MWLEVKIMSQAKCFENKVVVLTGGAHGIGACIKEQFEKQGARVYSIDLVKHEGFQGDVGKREDLESFVQEILAQKKQVDYIINNAKPPMIGIDEADYDAFNEALRIGITAPFWLVRCLKEHLASGASVINISSSRGRMSQPQTESYSAAKGGIDSLTHALAMSLAGKARVNAVSPGWIDVDGQSYRGSDANQHPVKRVGKPEDIANMVLFLCSEEAGFITGQNICIDGGMTKQMIYHADFGWSLDEE